MGVKRQTALQCGDAIDQTRSDWRGNAEKSRTWRDSRGSRDWRDRCKGRGVAVEDAAVEDPRKVVAGKQDEKMEVGFE